MARGATVKRLNQPLESELSGQLETQDEVSGVLTPRVSPPASLLEDDAYRQQLERDLSDFAHPDFANEITPVVDVRDLFESEEEFEAAFPGGWGQQPVPALPRGSQGVPEVDLDELLDAVESRRNADLRAPWTRAPSGATDELVVHGALRLTGDPDAAEVDLHSPAGSGSMWSTMRPPPLSSGDREAGVGREPTASMKATSQDTGAGWRASHGPVTPPASVLPPSLADDDDAPTPLLLTRVRSSPPPAPAAPGSSIAPVYYTDAPPSARGELSRDGSSWTGLVRAVPAWALALASAASASALTLVVLGWSSGRPPTAEPVAIPAPTSAQALLAAAATPSTEPPIPDPDGSGRDFDRAGAEAALARAAAQAASCPALHTSRAIDVKVTFTPAGTVSRALVLDSRLLGTPQDACVMNAFLRARIPPFPAPAVTLRRSVRLRSAD